VAWTVPVRTDPLLDWWNQCVSDGSDEPVHSDAHISSRTEFFFADDRHARIAKVIEYSRPFECGMAM